MVDYLLKMTAPETRQEKLLSCIDRTRGRGFEIGALNNPILTKKNGEVAYVDYTRTEVLREKYAADPNVKVEEIVEVDTVWGERSLYAALGRRFDYCIASHVIEHVPDLVTWLKEIAEALVEGGIASFAIPNKRYTFDYRRRLTEPADVIGAYLQRLRKPSARQIFDFHSQAVEIDSLAAWEKPPGDLEVKAIHTPQGALAVTREAAASDAYHDVHCWVFTPASFFRLLAGLSEIGLIDFEVAAFFDTGFGEAEFFVALRKLPEELPPEEKHRAFMASLPSDINLSSGESEAALRDRLERVETELAAIKRSRAWKLVSALRRLRRLFAKG